MTTAAQHPLLSDRARLELDLNDPRGALLLVVAAREDAATALRDELEALGRPASIARSVHDVLALPDTATVVLDTRSWDRSERHALNRARPSVRAMRHVLVLSTPEGLSALHGEAADFFDWITVMSVEPGVTLPWPEKAD